MGSLMSKKPRISPDELARQKQLYGEVVSFRLKRSVTDHEQVLEELDALNKDQKVDLFVKAVLNYLGKPIHEDNAATAEQLRAMMNEVIKALGEANQIISKLRQGNFKLDDGENKTVARINALSEDFISKMNSQQRAAKTLRPPSDDGEE
jgi:hypothetical protein